MNPPPLLLVLSGPSGVGKDAVVSGLKAQGFSIHTVVTVTTRPPRPGEQGGVDYRFVSPEQFQLLKEGGELLEWAQVYGQWYGVPRRSIKDALGQGQDVLVKVDVQGAATLKQVVPEAVFIFLVPPRPEELSHRLRQRRTESPEQLELRLSQAREELKQIDLFDYIVVNEEVSQAIACLQAIITAEKCRTLPRQVRL